MRILFVCTANACRSQMAEAWARHLFPEGWTAASAGLITHPIGDRTRAIMAEVGRRTWTDRSPSRSTPRISNAFDLVVTLSDEAGRFLPALIDPDRHRRCPVPDPMAARGTPEQIRTAYRAGPRPHPGPGRRPDRRVLRLIGSARARAPFPSRRAR